MMVSTSGSTILFSDKYHMRVILLGFLQLPIESIPDLLPCL